MSDETPTGETEPGSAAEQPVEPAAAPEPAPAGPAADATAAEPAVPEPATAETAIPEPATAETAAPVAAAASPPPARRGGILVPMWAAIMVAVLLIGGVGFAIGYWTADDDGSDAANASSSQLAPNRGGPFSGNGGGYNGGGIPNGNGNGQTAAQIAFLGVELESAANNGGARISSVRAGSPAADAGLKSGDVVTKIGDTTVADDDDLIRAIRAQKPGDEVTVTYTRDGNSAQVKVTLGDRSDATRSSVSP